MTIHKTKLLIKCIIYLGTAIFMQKDSKVLIRTFIHEHTSQSIHL